MWLLFEGGQIQLTSCISGVHSVIGELNRYLYGDARLARYYMVAITACSYYFVCSQVVESRLDVGEMNGEVR
jgi:hypothetical protein